MSTKPGKWNASFWNWANISVLLLHYHYCGHKICVQQTIIWYKRLDCVDYCFDDVMEISRKSISMCPLAPRKQHKSLVLLAPGIFLLHAEPKSYIKYA